MVKTVFTSITNNYDTLHPQKVTDGWNYLLFTDKSVGSIWGVKQIKGINPILLSKKVKILYMNYIKADISIYIAGNFEIIGDLNEFLKEIKYTSGIMTCQHPDYNTLREELNQIISLKKATVQQVNNLRLKLDNLGKPGLSETGVIVRDRSIPDYYYRKWYEMLKICPRDQASFDWIFREKVKRFPIEIRNKYFLKHSHK